LRKNGPAPIAAKPFSQIKHSLALGQFERDFFSANGRVFPYFANYMNEQKNRVSNPR